MGMEFVVEKELANISVTLTEFSAVTRIVNGEIGPGPFSTLFNAMMDKMAGTYDVVIDQLQPLIELDTAEAFNAEFDARLASYRDSYLMAISSARTLVVDAYEDYVHLVCMREAKTGFPLLKRTFQRLAELADKWITNDYWLSMSIDTLYKMLPRLLQEIAELRQKDPEDAYLIFSAAFSDFDLHLDLIRRQNARFHAQIRPPEAEIKAG